MRMDINNQSNLNNEESTAILDTIEPTEGITAVFAKSTIIVIALTSLLALIVGGLLLI